MLPYAATRNMLRMAAPILSASPSLSTLFFFGWCLQIKAAVMVEDAFTALALAGGLALTLWALVARVLAAAP